MDMGALDVDVAVDVIDATVAPTKTDPMPATMDGASSFQSTYVSTTPDAGLLQQTNPHQPGKVP